ncbi:MAG: hypothetical protein R2770_06375 [Acidimicrobiales bacterium]
MSDDSPAAVHDRLAEAGAELVAGCASADPQMLIAKHTNVPSPASAWCQGRYTPVAVGATWSESRRGSEVLPNAWYVLCYHDVGWSEHPMLRGLGLTHPTDVFGSHVAAVADQAELLGWREALDAFQAGRLSGPS